MYILLKITLIARHRRRHCQYDQFVIDNIFIELQGRTFQQTVGIPMGTNCAPLLADLFLHSYEAEFVKIFFVKEKRN